ncbi:MAG: hypothetical protein QXL86_02220 [Candidatus Aenigmatarchaeota archaeon]
MREGLRSSIEYKKFLESFKPRNISLYERLCNFFDRVNVPMPKSLKQKYQEEIDFCHLNITPNGAFITSFVVPALLFIFISIFFALFGLLSQGIILLNFIFSVIIFYYLFTYTHFSSLYFRSNAAADMALSIVYMAISLKTTPNLERAISFTASNLSGPLGMDFKKATWDLQTGNVLSATEALDNLAKKWKNESQEFVDAISLIKSSIGQTPSAAEKSINEAISTMLYGTKERMKKYARNMRNPLKILYAFGLLLPMLTLVFIPMVIIFMPEISQPELFAFFYNLILPASLFLFLRQYFYAKPYSYHQIELKNLESYRKQRKIMSLIITLISLPLIFFLSYQLISITSIFSEEQFFLSLFVIVITALSISSYCFILSYFNKEKNQEIMKIETELPIALFQLASESRSGKPIEMILDEVKPKIRETKIVNFFDDVSSNIKFGKTFKAAVLNSVIKYPSRILSAVMKTITDIADKGVSYLSSAINSISTYLKEAEEVKNSTDEILSDVTSEMSLQAMVFAPVILGIVVSLMAFVLYTFSFFGGSLEELQKFFGRGGVGTAALTGFQFLFQIGKQVPFHYFQIIVGTYLIEIVITITYFLGSIKYGDDEIGKMGEIGKILFTALIIYISINILMYLFMTVFFNLTQVSM